MSSLFFHLASRIIFAMHYEILATIVCSYPNYLEDWDIQARNGAV